MIRSTTGVEIEDYGPKMHPRYGVKILVNGEAVPDLQVGELSDDPYHLTLLGHEKITEYLARNGPDAAPPQYDDHSYRGTWAFARIQKFERLENLALLVLDGLGSVGGEPAKETFNRFERAVTWWLRNTEHGKRAWGDSVEDFNIADFIDGPAMQDSQFLDCCERLGVRIVSVDQVPFDHLKKFDRILNLDRHLDE